MKTFFKRILIVSIFLLNSFVFAEKTPFDNLFQEKLENGLEVFVLENHTVPLVYVEIAVKCGAFTQEEETSGLFHLYEHLMFKGNSKYKSAQEVNKALNDLGTASWNGTTGLECVNYYFTIPKDQLKEGLEFWSSAIRNPLLDKKELESEKKVVLSEIQRDFTEPESILSRKISETLYPRAPWKMTPGGSLEAVKNASVKQLKKIQKEFYIPGNSALFIGGDINPEEVFSLVKSVFSDWKKAPSPFEKNGKSTVVRHEKNPLSKPEYFVMPFDKMSKNLFQVIVKFRGPDAEFEVEDTYPLDMVFQIAENPKSYFKKFFTEEINLSIPEKDYINAWYSTYRTCGSSTVQAIMESSSGEIPIRAKQFAENISGALEKSVLFMSDEDFELIKQRLKDDMIFSTETTSSFLSILRKNWISSSAEYFYTYNLKMNEVTKEEMLSAIEKYIKNLNPFIIVLVNPEVFAEYKLEFQEHGFSVIEK